MKKVILLIFTICLSLPQIKAQNINVSGNISANTIWDTASIDTVKIIGNTTIDYGVTLIIEPGIVIDFTDNYFFNADGRLIANGTVSDSITFTTSDTTGFSTNTHHGWSGIRIYNTQSTIDTVQINYCIIEYGKSANGGGLYSYLNYKLSISNTTFRNNYASQKGGAFYDYQSFGYPTYYKVANCNFINNTSGGDGGAIYSERSDLTIDSCLFEYNVSINGNGGAIRDGGSFSSISIYRSRFSYNSVSSAGGAIYLSIANSSTKHTVKQTIFNNNTATSGGAVFLSQVIVDFQNNILVNNESSDKGGALYFNRILSTVTNSASMFANNTIANNKAVTGGGLYSFDNQSGVDLFLNKIIFYNNETTTAGENDDVMFFSQLNENRPRVYTCSFTNDLNNAGAWIGYIYNNGSIFNTNPLFKIPSTGTGANFEGYIGKDWSLDCSSPCVNPTGSTYYIPDSLDYRNTPRMVGDTIDIGAFESYDFLTLPQPLEVCEGDTAIFSATFYYPNADINNIWWGVSPDNGVNWYVTVNYTENWIFSTNTLASHDGYLIRLEGDFGCGYTTTNPVLLTVRPKALTQQTKIACDSYFVGGALQITSGVYYDTLNTSYGCDSIIETTLTINNSFYSSSTIDICQGDSALIFGNYEMLDSLYTDSLQTINGCDSVYHIQLNVAPTYIMNENAAICSNDSIYLQGAWQTTMNFYYDTLQTASSCDSVIITFLTVNQVSSAVIDTSFCSGLSIDINGTTYNQSGTYTQNFTNIVGCDSTLTINITENPLPNANIGPDTLLVCDGEVLGFGLDSTTGIVNYTIGNFITLATNDSLIFVFDALNAPSSVVSQVTDINGCVNNDQVILQNNAIQYLQIGVPTFYDPFLDFTIANMPSNVDSWYWSFGDGDTLSGDVAPTHEYLTNGSYQACLIGENMCGVDSSCITFDIFTVSISENNISNNISIYPNPVSDVLFINSEGVAVEYISIISVTGKIVKKSQGNTTQVDVSNLPKGLYLLEIKTINGIGNKRFVKL